MDYFEAKLDDKNRITVPSELQKEFGGRAVLTFGFGKYLHLYSAKVWFEDVQPFLSVDVFDEDAADLAEHLNQGKTDMELDKKQGRLTLKKHLKEYAEIGKEVVVINVGRYWRIIAKEKAS